MTPHNTVCVTDNQETQRSEMAQEQGLTATVIEGELILGGNTQYNVY